MFFDDEFDNFEIFNNVSTSGATTVQSISRKELPIWELPNWELVTKKNPFPFFNQFMI